jgi:hypothetical protein
MVGIRISAIKADMRLVMIRYMKQTTMEKPSIVSKLTALAMAEK